MKIEREKGKSSPSVSQNWRELTQTPLGFDDAEHNRSSDTLVSLSAAVAAAASYQGGGEMCFHVVFIDYFLEIR